MKKLAIAIAMASAASTANAAWESGQGELILHMWNPETTNSVSIDLNDTYNNFSATNDGQLTHGDQTYGISAEALAYLGDFSDVQWNVYGYQNGDATFAQNSFGAMFVDSIENPTTLKTWNINAFSLGAKTADSHTRVNRAPNTAASADEYLTTGFGTSAYSFWGARMNTTGDSFGITRSAFGNQESAQLLQMTLDNNDPQYAQNLTHQLGRFTLDLEAGQLVYSEVPVPAAAWLFGSALVGLVGISRRRRQA